MSFRIQLWNHAAATCAEYRFALMFGGASPMYPEAEGSEMDGGSKRTHKHFQLDVAKLKRAQTILRARTQTETIELALDLVIAEHRRNRVATEASERFVRSGIEIKDVYGNLAD